MLDEIDEILPFGSVIQFIPEASGILLVMPSDPSLLLDLDNLICMPEEADSATSKMVVGFVSDVVGPVNLPMYCVAIYKKAREQLEKQFEITEDLAALKEKMIGRQLCLVKKSLKTINAELPSIMNKKGCDASNVWDEEASDKEFSDDEMEQQHKKLKKNRKRNNNTEMELEDGEIPDSRKKGYSKPNYENKRPKRENYPRA